MCYAHFFNTGEILKSILRAYIQATAGTCVYCILIYDLCNEFTAKQWARF